ncbi:MAG: hypothetical protein ACI87W_000714 [Halieaceae bacterium]|jgi:uncharacterized protein (TIGR02099 family)
MSPQSQSQSPVPESDSLHRFAPALWRLLVVAVVLLAVYVSAGRYAMNQVESLRPLLLEQLNARLPFVLSVERLDGGWSAFSPELRFRELLITQSSDGAAPLRLAGGSLRIDVPASIAAGSLQLSRLEVEGLSLEARLTPDGAIEMIGFAGSSGSLRPWLEDFLPRVERVTLKDNAFRLHVGAQALNLNLNLFFTREGNARILQGRLQAEHLELAINAEGKGNPLRPLSWSGNIYLDAFSDDLSTLASLWETLDLPFTLSGAAGAEFWLSRVAGESTARLRWDGQGLDLNERHGAWSLPLDALSFEAALDQRRNHWTLLAEDFHIERAGQALDLERIQFDWWGRSLRMRVSDLGLNALPTLLAAAPGLPAGLREALPSLSPRGHLRALELRLDDLSAPAQSWSLRSDLQNFSVESWRSTPAVSGVSGYLELAAGDGSLQLDSRDFSMHFPKAYKEPLRYDDAHGEIALQWDAQGLRIDSGLLQLSAEEGDGRALLAAYLPFDGQATGPELELLIGLQNSRAQFLRKYLSYRLPAPLLGWLERAVREAHVQRAGFIWRGSLKREMAAHRTIQLFLDADRATLAYDPAWPELESLEASVWVDDRLAWARANGAVSAGAELSDVMLRVAPAPGGSLLDLAGSVSGDAAAAGTLLRESPLAALTQDVFADWRFSGPMGGTLGLSLPLTGKGVLPTLDLDLSLDGIQVDVAPLKLPLEDIRGTLRYRSASGFADSAVAGTLWNSELRGRAIDAGEDPLALELQGSVSAAAVADWLALPLLNFAQGSAQFEGTLRLPAGAEGQLGLASDLLGISLDVPAPFDKTLEQPLPLQLTLPLRSNPTLQVSLGERLHMDIALVDGQLQRLAAAVGANPVNPGTCEVLLCLSGSVSTLDIVAWSAFYQRYLAPEPSTPAPGSLEARPAESLPSYSIDSLDVGELRLGSRSFGETQLDLSGSGSVLQGALESSWVQGALTTEDDSLRLIVEYLDLARIEGGEPLGPAQLREVLPSMRVDILELRDDGQDLGTLGFDLDMQQPDGGVYARAIEGTLWGLRLDSELPGMLGWFAEGDNERSVLELDTAFADLGSVLEAAGYAPTLESESGKASLRLAWPAAPTGFALQRAEGSISLSATDGRLLDNPAGALAMVSFLNFAEILRGLSLSHMFESGIPFVTADTEIRLHRGILEIVSLHVDGAASEFAFNGLSNLATGSIDGELAVTLPVANNLPWVAALAGGLPIAAGVFVVSKVLQKQVNRMASAVYGISGAVDNPTVEFRRLFDDELTKTPEPAESPSPDSESDSQPDQQPKQAPEPEAP